jgi:hypothetical protein
MFVLIPQKATVRMHYGALSQQILKKSYKKSILLKRVTQEIIWSKYSRRSEGFILSNRAVSPMCANFQSKQTKMNGYFSHFPTTAIRSSEYLLILNTDTAISLS